MPGLRARLGERLGNWLDRHGGPRHGDVTLDRRSIYILPSRPGLLMAAVLAAMLIASMNYRLQLGYGLTFLLGAVALVGMLHTFRNLTRLTLRPGRAEPVFAGQLAEFTVLLINPSAIARHAIRIESPGMARVESIDLDPGSEKIATLTLQTMRRGWMALPRLRLKTGYPLGIWQAWSRWHPAMTVLVYPEPETPPMPLPDWVSPDGDGSGASAGQEDVAGLQPYAAGDSPRRIAWKAVARLDGAELLTKMLDGGERGRLLLDWNRLPPQMDVEARLSRLTRWVLDADQASLIYGIELPGRSIPADAGPAQRLRCLEALATFGA